MVDGWVVVAGANVVVETYVLVDVESGPVHQLRLEYVKTRKHTNDRCQSRLNGY